MAQDTSQTPIPQNGNASGDVPVMPLSRRGMWATMCLVSVTISALWVAWRWPEQTLLHFWLVTQAVPILYLFLAWWGGDALPSHDSDAV